MVKPLIAFALSLPLLHLTVAHGGEVTPAKIVRAVEGGLRIVQKGAQNYPKNRDCFSCHHQTLPMLAMREASDAGVDIDEVLLREQGQFIREAFEDRLDSVNKGKSVGGRSLTAAYLLWSFQLGGMPKDDFSDAFVSYLLHQQKTDGHWDVQSRRPPSEESKIHTSYLATYYTEYFVRGKKPEQQVEAAGKKARSWLFTSKPHSQEDFNGRFKALLSLGGSPRQINVARQALLKRQRDDGGWSQLPDMASDAYATGQTLHTLVAGTPAGAHNPKLRPAIDRALAYLLRTQKEDGSWFVKSRSKPIQKFFDNGDPHGKDQFISMAATSWATAALAKAGILRKNSDKKTGKPR
ncbi:MAG: prenyltransferase/squalene oxidase repeat-containing protein [Verrucomicrobiales bacterium]